MANGTLQDYVTVLQAAHMLGLSPQRVRQLANAGRLAYERTALGRLIDPASVEALRRSKPAKVEAGAE